MFLKIKLITNKQHKFGQLDNIFDKILTVLEFKAFLGFLSIFY